MLGVYATICFGLCLQWTELANEVAVCGSMDCDYQYVFDSLGIKDLEPWTPMRGIVAVFEDGNLCQLFHLCNFFLRCDVGIKYVAFRTVVGPIELRNLGKLRNLRSFSLSFTTVDRTEFANWYLAQSKLPAGSRITRIDVAKSNISQEDILNLRKTTGWSVGVDIMEEVDLGLRDR